MVKVQIGGGPKDHGKPRSSGSSRMPASAKASPNPRRAESRANVRTVFGAAPLFPKKK